MRLDPSVLDRIRVASPCPAGWNEMSGDERVRFCNSCSLHVYNISEMTRRDAAALIAETEGRLCVRLLRPADGTVITRDCPIGLRAIRRRVARFATAALVVVTTLCSHVFASNGRRSFKVKAREDYSRPVTSFLSNTAAIGGTITDPNGKPISGATVTLTNMQTNQR